MEINIESQITLTIGGQTIQMTQQEVVFLYEKLKMLLGRSDIPAQPFVPHVPYYPSPTYPTDPYVWYSTQTVNTPYPYDQTK